MIKITINGLELLVKKNLSVLEACKYIGINIPRFCYHETLSVAGNCRMCLVEIGNTPKPVASCALPVLNNMKIFVDTPLVKKARENVLESLLLNHPLDCPICDQGGECDLQDQTKVFGSDSSRFFFNKRSVEDKYCGPLIKTIMTRCIHCTRCVRYSSEIAGVDFFGTLNRGGSTEIGGYLSKNFNSEISGNVIDLCPVGALTSKSYVFKARPWELRTTESIDLTDSTGSNIYINFKESEIVRINPKINFEINDNIISDKARFSFDSNKLQRIKKLYSKKNSLISQLNWEELLNNLEQNLKSNSLTTVLINSELDLESLNLLKQLALQYNLRVKSLTNSIISSNVYLPTNSSKINDIKATSNVCFVLSSNIRFESAILNSKLRLKFLSSDIKIFGLNLIYNSNFPINFINLNIYEFILFLEGKSNLLSKLLIKAENPIFLIGESLYKRGFNFNSILSTIKKITNKAIILNIRAYSNSESLSYLNITPISKKDLLLSKNIIALNLENTFLISKLFLNFTTKNVYWLNSHGSKLALGSNFIIPIASDFEVENLFLNLEQRLQKTFKVLNPIGNSRSLKHLFNLLIKTTKKTQDFSFLNEKFEMLSSTKLFSFNKNILLNSFSYNDLLNENSRLITLYPIKSSLEDFYQSNKLSKQSILMSKSSKEFRSNSTNFF